MKKLAVVHWMCIFIIYAKKLGEQFIRTVHGVGYALAS